MIHNYKIEARTGRAFRLAQGMTLRIVNTFGTQVVDTWAFCANDVTEFMSMEHTRVHSATSMPVKGTIFRSSRRRPLLEFVKDTSPGVHDWFFAACDNARYEMLGYVGAHDNCADNLRKAMATLGYIIEHVPCPLNLFENAPLLQGDTSIHPPVSNPGDLVELTVLADLIVCVSACPQDLADTNGIDRKPQHVQIQIFG